MFMQIFMMGLMTSGWLRHSDDSDTVVQLTPSPVPPAHSKRNAATVVQASLSNDGNRGLDEAPAWVSVPVVADNMSRSPTSLASLHRANETPPLASAAIVYNPLAVATGNMRRSS